VPRYSSPTRGVACKWFAGAPSCTATERKVLEQKVRPRSPCSGPLSAVRRRWKARVEGSFKSHLRYHLSHLRHAHRVSRIRGVLANVRPGCTPWVPKWVCYRHPHARHDRRRVWAGHRPVARQRVSPFKRLADASGPLGECWSSPLARRRMRRMPRCAFRNVGAPRNGCRPVGRSDEFAASTHRGISPRPPGTLSSFPRRMTTCGPSAWLRPFCNPDAGPATCARCAVRCAWTGIEPPSYCRGVLS
jgi:hypothetical protein